MFPFHIPSFYFCRSFQHQTLMKDWTISCSDFRHVVFAMAVLHGATEETRGINAVKATRLNFLTVVATMFRNA